MILLALGLVANAQTFIAGAPQFGPAKILKENPDPASCVSGGRRHVRWVCRGMVNEVEFDLYLMVYGRRWNVVVFQAYLPLTTIMELQLQFLENFGTPRTMPDGDLAWASEEKLVVFHFEADGDDRYDVRVMVKELR